MENPKSEGMEKYGVVEKDAPQEESTKTATGSNIFCPDCVREVEIHGDILKCPNCGTKPFEV